MNQISLNGVWNLYYAPEKNGRHDAYTPGMEKAWTMIPGQVPGNVQLDLVQAGVEKDPYYGDNLLSFAPYEYAEWLYVRSFQAPDDWQGDRVILRFDGIDT